MPALPRLPVPAEHRILKWACELSPRTQRRLFGAPPRIGGQPLAGDIQALIRIAELAESNSFLVGMGIEEARASARHEAEVTDSRPPLPMAAVRAGGVPGPGRPIPGR